MPCRPHPDCRPVAISVLAALLGFLSVSQAWGPFTHQHFACVLLNTTSSFASCTASTAGLSFVMGAAAPDSVKYLAPFMHTLEFSGFQEGGFGTHLAEDGVGHHSSGYINPAEDHLCEYAADSYFVHTSPDRDSFVAVSDEAMQLMAAAAAAYAPMIGAPVPSLADVQQSARKFNLLGAAEQLAIRIDSDYLNELIKFDSTHVQTAAEAIAHLEAGSQNSTRAAAYWLSAIEHEAYEAAAAATNQFIDEMFE